MKTTKLSPSFSEYDIIHLGVSGGKDSTAVLLWAVNEAPPVVQDKLIATFCDTGNEDPLTYAYLDYLSNAMHRIITLYPDRDFWELVKHKKRFPSRRARFCTSFLKIIPIRNYLYALQETGKNILLINGVRSDEAHASNNRGSIPAFGWDEDTGCDIYRPLLDWSIDDVWDIHKRHLDYRDVLQIVQNDKDIRETNKTDLIGRISGHGIARNPLYDMNCKRVGCFPCIHSSKSEIRAMAKFRPERIDFIDSHEGTFNDNPDMYCTMFARNTVPEQHRTKTITTRSGEQMNICTIRDVVNWSKTAYGGKQYEFDIYFDDFTSCDTKGMCE